MTDDVFEKQDSKKQEDVESYVIQNIMKSRSGRDFMMKNLQVSMVFESIFHTDPIIHAYNSGLRDSGLNLAESLEKAAPNDYIKMIKGE